MARQQQKHPIYDGARDAAKALTEAGIHHDYDKQNASMGGRSAALHVPMEGGYRAKVFFHSTGEYRYRVVSPEHEDVIPPRPFDPDDHTGVEEHAPALGARKPHEVPGAVKRLMGSDETASALKGWEQRRQAVPAIHNPVRGGPQTGGRLERPVGPMARAMTEQPATGVLDMDAVRERARHIFNDKQFAQVYQPHTVDIAPSVEKSEVPAAVARLRARRSRQGGS